MVEARVCFRMTIHVKLTLLRVTTELMELSNECGRGFFIICLLASFVQIEIEMFAAKRLAHEDGK